VLLFLIYLKNKKIKKSREEFLYLARNKQRNKETKKKLSKLSESQSLAVAAASAF
jgi:hypothetical protein